MHGDDYTPKRDSTRPALQNAVDVTDGHDVPWAACQDGGRLHPTPPRQTDPTAGDLAGNAAGQTTLHVVKTHAVPLFFLCQGCQDDARMMVSANCRGRMMPG